MSYSVINFFPQTAIKMSLINLPAFTDKEWSFLLDYKSSGCLYPYIKDYLD